MTTESVPVQDGLTFFQEELDRRLIPLGEQGRTGRKNYTIGRLIAGKDGAVTVVLEYEVDDQRFCTGPDEITFTPDELRAGLRELRELLPQNLLADLTDLGPAGFLAAMRQSGAPTPIQQMVRLRSLEGFPITEGDWPEHMVLFQRMVERLNPLWQMRVRRTSFISLTSNNDYRNFTWLWVLGTESGRPSGLRIKYKTEDLETGRFFGDFLVTTSQLRRAIDELHESKEPVFFLRELNGMPVSAHDKTSHWLALMNALFVMDPIHQVTVEDTTITGTKDGQGMPWLLVAHSGGQTTQSHFFVSSTALQEAMHQLDELAGTGFRLEQEALKGFRGLLLTKENWARYREALQSATRLLA
jgi:hypothetical protein